MVSEVKEKLPEQGLLTGAHLPGGREPLRAVQRGKFEH